MAPSNSSYLSNTAIFHFHDCRRMGICLDNPTLRKKCFRGESCLSNPFRIRISNILLQKLRRFSFCSPDSWPSIPKFQKVQYSDSQAKIFFSKRNFKLVSGHGNSPNKIRNGGNKGTSYSWGQLSAPQNHWLHQGLMLWIGWEKNTFDKGGWKNNILSPILGWYKKTTAHMYTHIFDHIRMYIIM